MKTGLTLKNFEKAVEDKIVQRGAEYFRGGSVLTVEQVGEEEYSAYIEGSSYYSVYIKLSGEAVEAAECDCPYDWGDICKHIVAILFYLTQSRQDPKDLRSVFASLTKDVSAEDLQKYVQNLLKKDRKFRRKFCDNFDIDLPEDDFEEYDEDYY